MILWYYNYVVKKNNNRGSFFLLIQYVQEMKCINQLDSISLTCPRFQISFRLIKSVELWRILFYITNSSWILIPKLETFVLYLSCTAAAAPEEIELELLNFQFWIWVKLQVVLNKLSIVEKEKNDYFAYLSSPVLQKKILF